MAARVLTRLGFTVVVFRAAMSRERQVRKLLVDMPDAGSWNSSAPDAASCASGVTLPDRPRRPSPGRRRPRRRPSALLSENPGCDPEDLGSNPDSNAVGTPRKRASRRADRSRSSAGFSGTNRLLPDTPGYPIVELGGIEPPSARWSPNLLRPFPTSQLTAAEPAGRSAPRGPLPGLSPASAVFRAVSGLSLRSTPTSVAGLWGSGPVRHRWSRFSSTSPEGSGGESELLVVGGSLCVPV